MYKKIEILKTFGTSVVREEYLNCGYAFNGNYLVISVRNESDKSIIYHPFNLDNVKSYKITLS